MTSKAVDSVVQVGVVVEDAVATARRYRELLGVESWYINEVDTVAGKGTAFHHRGQAIEARARIAWARVGNLEIELIEPRDADSVYAVFLDQHGPGLHHLMFGGIELKTARASMAAQGIEELAGGELLATQFALFDTRDELGVLCEIAAGGELTPDYKLD